MRVTRTSYDPDRRPPEEGGNEGGADVHFSPVGFPESEEGVELDPPVGPVATVGSCPREASQPTTPVSDNTTATAARRTGFVVMRFRGSRFRGVSFDRASIGWPRISSSAKTSRPTS